MIDGARAIEQGFEGSLLPAWVITGPSATQMQYLQNKIVEGQVGVVTDIGKLALTYRAAGGNADAALQVAALATSRDARVGFQRQAESDSAWAAGNRQLSAQLGRDAAIRLGIHEQTRLQDLLWEDDRVNSVARALNIFGGVDTNIQVTALGKTIVAPETGSPWLPDFFDPSNAFGAGPWNPDHRIAIATNAFNKMHDWVYAPNARGQGTAMEAMREHASQNHFHGGNDHRAVWSSSDGGTW